MITLISPNLSMPDEPVTARPCIVILSPDFQGLLWLFWSLKTGTENNHILFIVLVGDCDVTHGHHGDLYGFGQVYRSPRDQTCHVGGWCNVTFCWLQVEPELLPRAWTLATWTRQVGAMPRLTATEPLGWGKRLNFISSHLITIKL